MNDFRTTADTIVAVAAVMANKDIAVFTPSVKIDPLDVTAKPWQTQITMSSKIIP